MLTGWGVRMIKVDITEAIKEKHYERVKEILKDLGLLLKQEVNYTVSLSNSIMGGYLSCESRHAQVNSIERLLELEPYKSIEDPNIPNSFKVRFAAIDEDGSVWFFGSKPSLEASRGVWGYTKDTVEIIGDLDESVDFEWTNSLVEIVG